MLWYGFEEMEGRIRKGFVEIIITYSFADGVRQLK